MEISGLADQEQRKDFIEKCMNEVDMLCGRTLGCRQSPKLRPYVNIENHFFRESYKKSKARARELESDSSDYDCS